MHEFDPESPLHLVAVFRFAGFLLLVGTAVYILSTLIAVKLRRSRDARVGVVGPVSVLKPLCGDEPSLRANLRSFCDQDHPNYQIIFGVRDAGDPALTVARNLQAEFPERDIVVVVDPRVHGINLKVSNLINLLPHVRHDWLVIADSDIAVRPDYLRAVTAPLARSQVGLVTCLYRGRAVGGFWSRLGVQFIDDWFRPSVRLAQFFGATRFGFGATLALRRDTLAAIGGLESVCDLVADDHTLGEKIADLGLSIVLSEHEIVTDVIETDLADLVAHEMRWFRTIRSVRPISYLGAFVCFTLPVALTGAALTGFDPIALALASLAVVSRLCLFIDSRSNRHVAGGWVGDFVAFLLRDTLSLLLWARAFFGNRVHWRGEQIHVEVPRAVRITS